LPCDYRRFKQLSIGLPLARPQALLFILLHGFRRNGSTIRRAQQSSMAHSTVFYLSLYMSPIFLTIQGLRRWYGGRACASGPVLILTLQRAFFPSFHTFICRPTLSSCLPFFSPLRELTRATCPNVLDVHIRGLNRVHAK